MANKTIPGLPDYGSQDSDKIKKDLLEITKNDGTYASPTYGTGASRKITVEDLKTALAITSQTVTNGVTTKSPSEDAVFDAIDAKGLTNGTVWRNLGGVGSLDLEADRYNIVLWSNTNIVLTLPAISVNKTIIVQGTTQDGSGNVNFTINDIENSGSDLGSPISVTVTDEKEVLVFFCNYYGWHLISRSSNSSRGTNTGDNATNTTSNAYADAKVADAINDGTTTIAPSQNAVFDALALKLDLDGGNANQDIDIGANKFTSETLEVNKASGSGVAVNIVKGGAGEALTVTKTSGSGNVASFNGGITLVDDIIVSGATASTIAHFDATKNIESLPLATYPNLTELSYVKGVTSAIQTQINAKVGGSGTTEFIPKFTASGTIGNSAIRQNYYDHATFIKGSVSLAYALSVFNDNESNGLLMIQNNGLLALLNSTKHQFGSNGVGQIIFDRNLTNNNLSFFRATDTSSSNYIQAWINSVESVYGLRYSNDLVAYWQSVNTTASTKISRWANSANTQVALIQNDGLYLGTGTKSSNAVLQADSTTQGFLPPRMTNAQRTSITSPAIGLMVYCTDATEGLYVYKSTGWTFII